MKTVNMIVAFACSAAVAQAPQMGGPMEHVTVHLHGNALEAHVHSTEPLVMQDYGEIYTGAASVLNGTFYNAQYGWMVEGFWSPPTGSFLWIEQVSATPGLLAYRGGMMGQSSFDPIFGTDGSSGRIMWNGSMLHNWYAATSAGGYTATYSVYFGDESGNATAGYEAGTAVLSWTAAPAPGAAGLLAAAGIAACRRRRGGA